MRFRVWSKFNKQYLEYDNYAVTGDGSILIWDWHGDEGEEWGTLHDASSSDEVGVVIQRFTGAVDCNGTKIFEGDILERKSARDNINYVFVEFNNDNYGFVMGWNLMEGNPDGPKEAYEYYYGKSPSKNWRVVGNIYENPELLRIPQR